MENLKMWVYGKPFSGKTKFATEFPSAYVINTDGNAELFTENVGLVRNLDEFRKELEWFLEGEHEYQTLVIDVVEHIYDFVRTYYLDKLDIDYEADAGYGKAWKMIREGFWTVMQRLAASKYNVILISHEEEYTEKNKIGREITKFRPRLDDKLHDRLCGIMKLVGRCFKDEVMLNGEPARKYYVSFGSNVDELSGVRIKLNSLKIENTYEDFLANLVVPVAKQAKEEKPVITNNDKKEDK